MLDFFRVYYVDLHEGIGFILFWLLFSIALVYIHERFLPTKKCVLIAIAKVCGIWLVALLMLSIIYMITRWDNYSSSIAMGGLELARNFVCGIIIACYTLFFEKSEQHKVMSAIYFCSVIILCTAVNSIVTILSIIPVLAVILDIIGYSVVMLIAWFVRSKRIKGAFTLPKSAAILIYALTGIISLMKLITPIVLIIFEEHTAYVPLLTNLAIFALILVTYFMFSKMVREYNNNLLLSVEKQMAKNDVAMLELTKSNLTELRALRHDLKNHVSYMRILLNENRLEEAKDYFNEIDKLSAEPLSLIDCGNKNINSVLNLEVAKAKSHGIKLVSNVNISAEFPVSDSDMFSLLTNLIDNAIEACANFGISDPIITVDIKQEQDYLMVFVSNPVNANADKEVILSLETQKEDKKMHGFGTKIIKRIAKNYKGDVSYGIENDIFHADVMLYLNYENRGA